MSRSQPAVFLDRDGTLIVDQHYPKDPEKVVLLPHVPEALKLMEQKGYWLFVISNQSGVGRGLITDLQFRAVHERASSLLKDSGVQIQEFAYCLHRPEDQCNCRKPKTGLIHEEFLGKKIDWKKSFAVGDKVSDLILGEAIGGKGALVLTGVGKTSFEELQASKNRNDINVFDDLLQFAESLPPVLA